MHQYKEFFFGGVERSIFCRETKTMATYLEFFELDFKSRQVSIKLYNCGSKVVERGPTRI